MDGRLSYGDAAFTDTNPVVNIPIYHTINFHKFKVVDADASTPSPIYFRGIFTNAVGGGGAWDMPLGAMDAGKMKGTLYNPSFPEVTVSSFEYTLYLYKDGSTTPLSTTSFPKLNDPDAFNITANQPEYAAQLVMKITPLHYTAHIIKLDFHDTNRCNGRRRETCGIMHRGDNHYRTTVARNGIRVWAGSDYFLHYSNKDGLHFKNGGMTILTDKRTSCPEWRHLL